MHSLLITVYMQASESLNKCFTFVYVKGKYNDYYIMNEKGIIPWLISIITQPYHIAFSLECLLLTIINET
jgi:hypothetical protein